MAPSTPDKTAAPSILGFAEALQLVLEHAAVLAPHDIETVPLLECLRRVLAADVLADRDQPPFNRSTRDGFAVRAEEWSTGEHLTLAGQLRAGETWRGGNLQPGTAIEIMTGAAVPPGANAIAMVEHVQHDGSQIFAAPGRQLRPGDNIVPRGSEARTGQIVLAASTTISPAEIALAATCGCATLAVFKRPTASIIATGDELVELNQAPDDHQIRNSNSYALAALVAAAGAQPCRLGIARDNLVDVRQRIAQGRTSNLIILSGGVSAGKYDLVEEVLAEFGAEFFFTGVKMQPGKPVVFGRLPARPELNQPDCYFFGLPGNPISTQVTFHCFVEPILRAMCGAPSAGPNFVQATFAEDAAAKPGLTRLLPARMQSALTTTQVHLETWQGSGDLAANARANCYAVLPDGRDLKTGDIITILLR